MQRSLWILVAGVSLAGAVSAQEPALSNMYGRGVHAYFDGQPRAAYQFLTAAIDAGSHDPRAFYFRGLTYQRLGRPAEAEADFRAGAEMEHQAAGGVYGVDRALERVQGAARLSIERHRAIARVEAVQDDVLERNRRSISARAAQPEVAAPGEQILSEAPANFNSLPADKPAPPVKGEVDKPFADPAADPAAPPPAKPAQPNPLNESPFGEPAKPVANPPANPAAVSPPANPALGNPAAANEANGEGSGSGRAFGNALKRAFGGLVPSVPELPAALPLGGEQGQAPNQPQQPPASAPANSAEPVQPAAPTQPAAPAKPSAPANDNPFATP